MACGCEQTESFILMPCKVCQLLDKDNTPKKVKYCEMCQAYICENDKTNILRRAAAAILDIRLKL